jgi:hypothetical protein
MDGSLTEGRAGQAAVAVVAAERALLSLADEALGVQVVSVE